MECGRRCPRWLDHYLLICHFASPYWSSLLSASAFLSECSEWQTNHRRSSTDDGKLTGPHYPLSKQLAYPCSFWKSESAHSAQITYCPPHSHLAVLYQLNSCVRSCAGNRHLGCYDSENWTRTRWLKMKRCAKTGTSNAGFLSSIWLCAIWYAFIIGCLNVPGLRSWCPFMHPNAKKTFRSFACGNVTYHGPRIFCAAGLMAGWRDHICAFILSQSSAPATQAYNRLANPCQAQDASF